MASSRRSDRMTRVIDDGGRVRRNVELLSHAIGVAQMSKNMKKIWIVTVPFRHHTPTRHTEMPFAWST